MKYKMNLIIGLSALIGSFLLLILLMWAPTRLSLEQHIAANAFGIVGVIVGKWNMDYWEKKDEVKDETTR